MVAAVLRHSGFAVVGVTTKRSNCRLGALPTSRSGSRTAAITTMYQLTKSMPNVLHKRTDTQTADGPDFCFDVVHFSFLSV